MVKLGLGESYDRVSILSVKTRAYLDLTKPASSVGVGGAYFLGSLFYFAYRGSVFISPVELRSIIIVALTMLFAHSASQSMNMAEDAEMDKQTEHKQNRPIPSGVVSEEEARSLAWIFMIIAIVEAFIVNTTFGLFVTVLAFFGVFYNLDPIRAKERIISIPWQAVSRGLLLFPTIWAAYGDPWQPMPWVLGLFMFFYVFGFQNSADIIDREVDKEFGIKTLVVMYGVKGMAIIASASMILMIVTIYLGIIFNFIPQYLIYILFIMPFCIIMLYHMVFNSHNISERTGNHPAWIWFYIGMVLSVLIPLIVEIGY